MTQRVVNYTYGTGNQVLPDGSIDVRDGIDNLQSFDIFMNAPEDTYNQRDGEIVSTISGANNRFNSQIINMGFTRIGTFASGATLTNPRQTLLWDVADGGDGQEYGWSGAFPKVVPASSTPLTTGGIAVGAWISRFDPEIKLQVREVQRRSYADAGYNLVDGSFEVGGILVNSNDVLLHEASGKAFSGSAGTVPAGTNPASGGFVDRSGELLRSQLTGVEGAGIVHSASGDSVQEEIDKINLSSEDKPKGASKEDGRTTSLGVNYVTTMKPSDVSSKVGSAGFNLAGEFTGDGSQNLAAWTLGHQANSFVCQGRIYFGAGVDNAFIGYNSSSFGSTDLGTFYSVGFTSAGFVFNDKVALQTLVPAVNLAAGWYEISMVYNTGFIFCSLCESGTTEAKTFTVSKTLPSPKNAQIGAFSTGDYVKDFRFSSSDSGNPWTPAFGGGRCIPLPITIPATNPSGVLISVHLPAGYDPRITHRLAVYCHGSGGTNTDMWDYTNENGVLTSLLSAGYVVMAANYASTGWGNQASIDQNVAAIQYIKDRYNVFDKPYMVIQSMGGMVGINTVIIGAVKPAAIAGVYPASNLLWQYQNGFTSAIEVAYGFYGAANFEAATAGHDALNDNSPRSFSGLAMKIWHSYQDTVVSRAENTDLLKIKVESGGGLVDVVTSTGQHGDPSSFDGSGIVAFFSDK